ncbi:L-fucose/L-arabinose isomerase family protein [Candidatus Leptofilum sp.]|uniref:L-fucose/L-arabinose isomerase family protein n=1 Tax=Candidatus Leptofilum sp. TaxID=3241576 RepID=UPI003B5A5A40
MSQPKIGLITFGDHRTHEWEHVFKKMTEPRHQEAVAYFEQLPVTLVAQESVARTKDEIDAQVDALRAAGVEVLIAHTPCWTSPNLVVRGIQRLNLPTVLLGNKHPGTHSTVGLLGAGGTLSQIGYPHMRLREDFTEDLAQKVMPYFMATAVKARLQGKMFGLFGGRSLGIDTGTFDPMQWKKLFGVDTEHIDQLEIIRRAELVPEADTKKMMTWLTRVVGSVQYNDDKFTPEKLAFQVRCYLATMEIIGEMGLDFVAIKCMPDLTTHFVPQCISAALLPSPYDADGRRDPIMMACEADGDAALTMEILKEISGGLPVLFMDVSYIDDERGLFYFPNCGAFCSWYAARSDDPAENMKHIELRPANRPAGGAITYFNTAPGDMTLARLYRENGRYRMGIISGETVHISPEEHDNFVQARGSHQLPTAFLKLDVDIDKLVGNFGSNHVMGVAGNRVEELLHFCELMEIEPVFFNE